MGLKPYSLCCVLAFSDHFPAAFRFLSIPENRGRSNLLCQIYFSLDQRYFRAHSGGSVWSLLWITVWTYSREILRSVTMHHYICLVMDVLVTVISQIIFLGFSSMTGGRAAWKYPRLVLPPCPSMTTFESGYTINIIEETTHIRSRS